jgi:hypothetical protein
MQTNTTDQFQVEHIKYVSDQPFDEVVAALRIGYDRPSSLLERLGNPELRAAAQKLGRQACGARRARHRRMSSSAESGTPGLELRGARTGNCLHAAIGLSEAGLPPTRPGDAPNVERASSRFSRARGTRRSGAYDQRVRHRRVLPGIRRQPKSAFWRFFKLHPVIHAAKLRRSRFCSTH